MTITSTMPTVLRDVPFVDYLRIDAMNFTRLKHYGVSALHGHTAEQTGIESDSLRRGRAVHTLTLEPEKFNQEYFVFELDGNTRTKAFREQKQSILEANADKTVLSMEEYKDAQLMASAIARHPLASKLLARCKRRELTITWQHGEVVCKARIDAFGKGPYGLVNEHSLSASAEVVYQIDIKTTRSIEPNLFSRAVADYRYDAQSAWYEDGVRAVDPARFTIVHLFIAVENKPPFDVVVYELNQDQVEVGRRYNYRCLEVYLEALRSGVYRGISESVRPLFLPSYLQRIEGVMS